MRTQAFASLNSVVRDTNYRKEVMKLFCAYHPDREADGIAILSNGTQVPMCEDCGTL
jgi:hypothetical protein